MFACASKTMKDTNHTYVPLKQNDDLDATCDESRKKFSNFDGVSSTDQASLGEGELVRVVAPRHLPEG